MLHSCSEELSINLVAPLSHSQLLIFIGWLLDRQVGADTINTYLAGLRQLYLSKGLNPASIRSDLVTQIIKGRRHQTLSLETIGSQKQRLPATPAILKLLKLDILASSEDPKTKLLIWAVCTLAYNGAFRIGELLAKKQTSFNPLDTLLEDDLKIQETAVENKKVKLIQVRLKQEKTNSSKSSTIIDVFEAPGPICPVRALQKWLTCSPLTNKKLPAFRKPDGRAYTGRELNVYLSGFSRRTFPNSQVKISAHSFRVGLASTLGSLGYDDNDIQLAGRWSSRAFESYLKLPRTKRIRIAREIGNLAT